jgi:hypothetical protein
MSDRLWHLVDKPASVPEGVSLETKIDDARGIRNVQLLKRMGNLWWFPDGSMYVYYVPTHWRAPEVAKCSGQD